MYVLRGSTTDIGLFPIRLKNVANTLLPAKSITFLFLKSKVKAFFYERAPSPTHQNVALCVYRLMEVGGRGGWILGSSLHKVTFLYVTVE